MSRPRAVLTHRVCKTCGVDKAIEEYNSAGNGFYRAHCRICLAAQQREWRAARPGYSSETHKRWRKRHPEKVLLLNRKWGLRRDFGITPEDYDGMHAAQGGKCAICGETEKYRRHLYIDHDHTTGEIRGLLCNRCNSMLGMARDRIHVLMAAIDYLERQMEACV